MLSNTLISSSRTVIQTLGSNQKIIQEHRKIRRAESSRIPPLPELPLGKQKCIYNRATFDAAAVLAYSYKSGCVAAGVPTVPTGRIQSRASGKHLIGVAFPIPRSEWDGTEHPLPPGPPVIGVAVKQRMHEKRPALDVLVPLEFNDRSVFKWTVSRIAEFRAQPTQSSLAQPLATPAGPTPAPQPEQPRQPSPSVTPQPELPAPAANAPNATAASPPQQKEKIVVYGLGHRVNDSLLTAKGKFEAFCIDFLKIDSLDGVRAVETLVSQNFSGRSRSVLVLEVPHSTRKAIWCAKSRLPAYVQVSIDYYVDRQAHRARIAQRWGPAVQQRLRPRLLEAPPLGAHPQLHPAVYHHPYGVPHAPAAPLLLPKGTQKARSAPPLLPPKPPPPHAPYSCWDSGCPPTPACPLLCGARWPTAASAARKRQPGWPKSCASSPHAGCSTTRIF